MYDSETKKGKVLKRLQQMLSNNEHSSENDEKTMFYKLEEDNNNGLIPNNSNSEVEIISLQIQDVLKMNEETNLFSWKIT